MLRFSLWKLAGEGLFTSNGELWRRQRRLMAPLFTPKALERYAGDMVACALRTVEEWGDGRELRLLDETTRLTMGIAGKTLFEADTFSEADEIGRALNAALDWTGWVVGRPLALAHVFFGDGRAVVVAQHGFEDDADAHRQARHRPDPLSFELRQGVISSRFIVREGEVLRRIE
jgi:cytochrome P450